MSKEEMIEFIVKHNPAIKKDALIGLSEISVFLIKIQVEIEISRVLRNNDKQRTVSQN